MGCARGDASSTRASIRSNRALNSKGLIAESLCLGFVTRYAVARSCGAVGRRLLLIRCVMNRGPIDSCHPTIILRGERHNSLDEGLIELSLVVGIVRVQSH